MSDLLSHWHVDDSWSYNHGRHPGINTDQAPAAFSGLNQPFWRRARSLEIREKVLMCPIWSPAIPMLVIVRGLFLPDSTYY